MARTANVAGIAVLAYGVGLAFSHRASQYKNEQNRKEAIAKLIDSVRDSFPKQLADRLITAFDKSKQDFDFDFDGEIERYFDNNLYRFLLHRVGEKFADEVYHRKQKFKRFEVPASLIDLLSRTIEMQSEVNATGETLASEFGDWLIAEQTEYKSTNGIVSDRNSLITNVKMVEFANSKRATFLEDCNVFLTDSGIAVIAEDYRLAHLGISGIEVFKDLNDFNTRNSKNKRWQHVPDLEQKEGALRPQLEPLLDALYPYAP